MKSERAPEIISDSHLINSTQLRSCTILYTNILQTILTNSMLNIKNREQCALSVTKIKILSNAYFISALCNECLQTSGGFTTPYYLKYLTYQKNLTKHLSVWLIHAQTLVILLSFTIWRSAYCLSIPKRRQCVTSPYELSTPKRSQQKHVCRSRLPEGIVCGCVVPTVSKNEYKGNAFVIVQSVRC
jgi:hypothetical protein